MSDDVPAKKVPAKKAPAKKVPAKKAPAKKVPAKKVPAKKAPARPVPPTSTAGSSVTDDGKDRDTVTPESLAAEIERTREDLAHTLDAIAEKVSPKRVASRTTKKVTQAVKDTAHDAAGSVRDGAHAVKDKVTGGGDGGDETVDAPAVSTLSAPYGPAGGTTLPTPYLLGGGVAALVVIVLLRRRRRR